MQWARPGAAQSGRGAAAHSGRAAERSIRAAVARSRSAGLDVSHIFEANKARGTKVKELDAELEGIETARTTILTALPNVPAAFKDSFLNRNPINRAVIAETARRFGPIDLA